MPEYQTVEIPRGQFIGWGRRGQVVSVKVVSFDPVGGTDFNKKTCPQLVGTLLEAADSYRDRGATSLRIDAGELVTITAGIYSLKMGLLAADPKPGDFVRMEYVDDHQVADGTAKDIKVQIARGAGQAVTADDV
jgi:hypothetical protein